MEQRIRFTSQALSGLLAAALALAGSSRVRAAATSQPSPVDASTPASQPAGDLTNLSLEDLMNVEVTSVSKKPQKIADAAAAVTVIGQDDIERSGLGSIPELLRLVPGMDVAEINANHWAVSSRGMNGYLADDLLVLMDGRSVYTPAFGGVTWNSVNYPLMDLDRIEAIRGPGSTLWGSNAVNGVVNIITKPANETQGVLLDARGGSRFDIGNVRYGGQLGDDTYYRVYSQYQYTGNNKLAIGDPAHDEWQGFQGGFRIDKLPSSTDTLTLQGDVFEQNLTETTTPTLGMSNTAWYQNGGNLLGRWSHTNSDRSATSIQAYYDRIVSNDFPLGYDQDTFDVEFQNRFPLGAIQDVTWGLGARDYLVHFTQFPGVTVAPKDRNEYIYNGFIQDQVTIVPDRLVWTIGTKLEYNNITQVEVDPSTRLLWTPNDRNSAWAAFSRSTRIPSLYEDSTINIGPIGILTSSPDAEITNTYELGYKVQPLKPVTFDVAGFYNTYENLVIPVPNLLNPTQVTYDNAADAQSYGGEISANWQVSPQCRLAASYTYLMVRGEPRIKSPADFFIPAYEVRFIEASAPQNQFQIHCYLDLLKNLQFNTSLYYVDALPFINSLVPTGNFQSVSSYFRLDMNLQWQIRQNMKLAVGVQNLLSSRHFEYGTIGTQAMPTAVPRTFFAEWIVTF